MSLEQDLKSLRRRRAPDRAEETEQEKRVCAELEAALERYEEKESRDNERLNQRLQGF